MNLLDYYPNLEANVDLIHKPKHMQNLLNVALASTIHKHSPQELNKRKECFPQASNNFTNEGASLYIERELKTSSIK